MGWFGKLTFGSLGLFFGGPLGAIAGAALGHHLIDKKQGTSARPYGAPQETRIEYAEHAQAAYFISLFSILGKIAKIDGVVTRNEIAVVQTFINGLQIPEMQKRFAKQIFSEAKKSEYSLEDFAVQLYQATRDHPTILLSFVDLLFRVVAADGTFHPAEESALKSVSRIFRISEEQYNDLKAAYFDDLDKYYRVLNSTPESSNEEIKANYKRLVKDFHPDMIVSKGLPEEFTDFAEKRFREIQEAYEKIRMERHF
jgi:DnaJ like chaperone protein